MYMVSQLNFIAKKTEKDLFSVITMIHSNRRWCYFCINIISSMWHAWHIYKIWWFKAICPTWCDWFCRVLCSLKPLCAKRDKKKNQQKKTKRNCIWIKVTVQYMCSMFCVLHVLVWNETSQNVDLFLPNESRIHAPNTCSITQRQTHTHTHVFALWGETHWGN